MWASRAPEPLTAFSPLRTPATTGRRSQAPPRLRRPTTKRTLLRRTVRPTDSAPTTLLRPTCADRRCTRDSRTPPRTCRVSGRAAGGRRVARQELPRARRVRSTSSFRNRRRPGGRRPHRTAGRVTALHPRRFRNHRTGRPGLRLTMGLPGTDQPANLGCATVTTATLTDRRTISPRARAVGVPRPGRPGRLPGTAARRWSSRCPPISRRHEHHRCGGPREGGGDVGGPRLVCSGPPGPRTVGGRHAAAQRALRCPASPGSVRRWDCLGT